LIWIIVAAQGGAAAGSARPAGARGVHGALRQVKAFGAAAREPASAPRPDSIMFLAMATSVVLVVSTILVLYETLRLTSEHLSELPIPPRMRILAVVLMTFIGHTVAVWIYAFAYWMLVLRLGIGAFAGAPVTTFEDCLYFSVVAYTSLGFGDHFPTSHTRLLAGVEALNGLLLIGWSASFTYLAMERYWPLHGTARAHHADRAGLGRGAGRKRLFPPAPGT
jgi:hypothetical protein